MSNLSELLPSGGGQNLVEFVASGTLPNGKPVILNSDGTATVVGVTPITESIPAGSEAIFNTGSSIFTLVAFDPNTDNKFIAVYKDAGNSEYGTAAVGTISGTSISFGSEVVFNTAEAGFPSVSFDPNTADKFVVVYRDMGNSGYGTAIVGTISGTSVSFGSKYVFNSASTPYLSVAFDPNNNNTFIAIYTDWSSSQRGTAIVGTISGTTISYGSEYVFNSAATGQYNSIAFDPNTTNKFVVIFKDGGNSNYGTAIVGTVASTTLSFGSEYVFNSASTTYISVSFDPNNSGKFVIAYRDNGNSSYGTTIIGTVSGTSVSFGSEYIFNSAATQYTSVACDPNTNNKLSVAYQDMGNSGYGTVIIGTISGTTVSYGSEYVINAATTGYPSVAFDPNSAGKFVVVYQDLGNSGRGTAIVGQMASGATNLTSTNLIGISSASASSGGTAKINTWGGINEAQTSLTIASDYYAQTDGTITTATAGQKLGTAISTTTINMKDLT